MLNEELFGRWTHLKHNVQHMWHNLQDKMHSSKKDDVNVHPIHIDNYHYESHRIDDVEPMSENNDEEVFYSDTENSEFSRGKPRAPAKGIDSFGEDDSIDSEIRH